MTHIQVASTGPAEAELDLLALLLFEGDAPDDGVDKALGGRVARAARLGDFKGKLKQTTLVYGDEGKGGATRVLLVGLGPRKGASLERVRRATGAAVGEARRLDARTLGVLGPAKLERGLDPISIAAASAEAAVLADYAFERHKTKSAQAAEPAGKKVKAKRTKATKAEAPKAKPPLRVELFAPAAAADEVANAVAIAEATNLSRDIANEPGNVVTPTVLGQQALAAGKKAGLKVKVLGPAEVKAEGMNALAAVAQGSHEPCSFIVMEHAPPKGKAAKGTVVLVGKGLTFDSGGISIKPADKMWEMKFDKCGGTAVIGAMIAVARLGLPLHVVGLVPSTENMPGGGAIKPGDVVRAANGKSIEILNTDAEGRLILADALSYAARYEPAVVIDIATLTGAVVVALGDIRAAVMGNDQPLEDALRAAGDATGELLWPLPMDDAYGEHVKGEVADVKNLGKGRDAGSIAGGWFLKHFVPEGAAWAHLDIAGTAWASSDPGKGYIGKGATGYGVRLLVELLRQRAKG